MGQLTNLIVHALVIAVRRGVSIFGRGRTGARAGTRLVVSRCGSIAVRKRHYNAL